MSILGNATGGLWDKYTRPANSGDNGWQAIYHDKINSLSKPSWGMFAGSWGDYYNGYKASQKWHDKKNDASTLAYDQRSAQQINDRDAQLFEREGLLDKYRSEDDTARAGALKSVDGAYGNRQGDYDAAYNANLRNALSGLDSQYRQGSQQSKLALAKRGRLGSSADAESQAGLQNRYQSGAMNAANDAYGYSQQLQDADYNQAQSLRRALLSGDPQSGAAYQAQAAGANNQSAALSGMSALQQQQRQINQQYGNALSQQYGGYANAAGNGIYAGYGVYGQGK